MKQITKNTILKQGDKTFQPVEVEGVIYWTTGTQPTFDDAHSLKPCYYIFKGEIIKREYSHHKESSTIIAQSQPKLEGVPVISLDSYVENSVNLEFKEEFEIAQDAMPAIWYDLKLKIIKNYKSNSNQYTQKDIEKAIELARKTDFVGVGGDIGYSFFKSEIFQQINSISIIEIDEQFNIISYE